jgi:hypothetical protein
MQKLGPRQFKQLNLEATYFSWILRAETQKKNLEPFRLP